VCLYACSWDVGGEDCEGLHLGLDTACRFRLEFCYVGASIIKIIYINNKSSCLLHELFCVLGRRW
jgi:hypothetical protein